jgi:hypothetical protein
LDIGYVEKLNVLVSGGLITNFFLCKRILARGVLKVRRGLKPAENAAHQKNSHLVIGINGFPAKHRQLASDPSPIISEFASFSNDTMTGNNK